MKSAISIFCLLFALPVLSQAKSFSCISMTDPYKTKYLEYNSGGLLEIQGQFEGDSLYNARSIQVQSFRLPDFGKITGLKTAMKPSSLYTSGRNSVSYVTMNLPKIATGPAQEQEVLRDIVFSVTLGSYPNLSGYEMTYKTEINDGPRAGSYGYDHFYMSCDIGR